MFSLKLKIEVFKKTSQFFSVSLQSLLFLLSFGYVLYFLRRVFFLENYPDEMKVRVQMKPNFVRSCPTSAARILFYTKSYGLRIFSFENTSSDVNDSIEI